MLGFILFLMVCGLGWGGYQLFKIKEKEALANTNYLEEIYKILKRMEEKK